VLRFVVRRVALSIPLVFIASILIFVLEALAPGDVARAILGVEATPARYLALRHQLGLDLPLWLQYWHYLQQVLRGSLGSSIETGQSVVSILQSRLPVTLSLMVLSTIVSAGIGIPLGVVSAIRPGKLGKFVDVISMAGLAVPSFWFGLVLMFIFAVRLGAFPATGYVNFDESPLGWIRSLVLPVVALGLSGTAVLAKTTRDSMLEMLNRDYIRMLRACGVGEWSIVWKHALKNAAVPVVSVLGLVAIHALNGTVFIENVFVLPGFGSLSVSAVLQHELPVIEGVAIYFTLIVVGINLLVDLAYGWLNPKIRTA